MTPRAELIASVSLTVLLAATAGGCSSADPAGEPTAVIALAFDPASKDFFATPWPSNARLLADGTVDLASFPAVDGPYLGAVRRAIEGRVHGFSTMPVGYFALGAHPGDAVLLAPKDTLAATAAVQLVALDGGHCGERAPIEMQVSVQPEDEFLPPNVLQIAPVPGFVLRQGVDYAFLVGRSFGAPVGLDTPRPAAFAAVLAEGATGPFADSLGPLRACAAEGAIDLDAIALATVFRVQDVLGPARALRAAVADPDYSDAPELSGWAADAKYSGTGYAGYTATYQTPIFQTGTSPYEDDGDGDIVFDDEGRPERQRWEKVPMLVLVPEGPGPFPVMIWVDGTGWTQWSHVKQSLTKEVLAAGFAVASYMPQFHGDRASPGASPEIHTYNFDNPTAGRNVLRQQLADTSYFVRVLREAVPLVADPPALDTDHLVLGGQSQGSQNGAMAAAIEPEIGTFVLNGLAAYLTITVLERKDGADYEALLKALLGISVEIDRFHPVLALLQLGADSVDLHNYAPAWAGWEGKPAGAHLFVLNGMLDTTTHPVGIDAITIAGDLAPIAPAGWNVDPFDVWSRTDEPLPISGNRTAFDEGKLTQATYLDAATGHYTIYDVPSERARAVAFLVDALDGVPTLAE